jgi:hypothetical protein
VTKHTRNQFFVEKFQNFFCKMFTMVLLDGILDDFSKFRLFIAENCILIWFFRFLFFLLHLLSDQTRKRFHHLLSIRGTNFITVWAYEETISSLAKHTRKCLKDKYLGGIEYDCQKSRVTGPWEYKD